MKNEKRMYALSQNTMNKSIALQYNLACITYHSSSITKNFKRSFLCV